MSAETEYLLARYAEDEAAARAATEASAAYGQGDDAFDEAVTLAANEGGLPEAVEHMRRWSPELVLADIAAKRKIVELHDSWPILVDQPEPPSAIGSALDGTLAMSVSTRMAWLTTQEYRKRFGDDPPTAPMISALLQPYAARDDFDPMWATSPEHEHQWIDVCTWEDHAPEGHLWKCHSCGEQKRDGGSTP